MSTPTRPDALGRQPSSLALGVVTFVVGAVVLTDSRAERERHGSMLGPAVFGVILTHRVARAAYGVGFTDAVHTCALVGGIGMLVAAVIALVLIGVRRPAVR